MFKNISRLLWPAIGAAGWGLLRSWRSGNQDRNNWNRREEFGNRNRNDWDRREGIVEEEFAEKREFMEREQPERKRQAKRR